MLQQSVCWRNIHRDSVLGGILGGFARDCPTRAESKVSKRDRLEQGEYGLEGQLAVCLV